MAEKKVELFDCFWQVLLTEKHHKKVTKSDVLRMQLLSIKVENFECGFGQSKTVKFQPPSQTS